jgi:hypothetical protein
VVIPLKALLELKKITASALVKLSKAPRIRSAGAFVLPPIIPRQSASAKL